MLVNKSSYHVCKCPRTCTIYPNKHTKCPGKATYNKSSDFSPTKVSKQCTHHLIRYVRSPLVLLGWLCLRKVYEGCSAWTYWSWRRVHGMLLLLLLLYSWPHCVCLWRLGWGKFHRQGNSSLLELSPVGSGHSQSEIIQPREKTVLLTITCGWWTPYKVACRLLHHCYELAVMAWLLIWGYLLILVSGSLLGSPNARWRCQRW